MAMNRSKEYGTRWESPSEQSPQGKFKDKSSETAVDGSYLERQWIDDISDGWNGAILKGYEPTQEQLDAINPLGYNAGGVIGTPVNEVVDEANNSQVYNAWYKHTQEVADGRIADKQLEEKIAELETLAQGCFFTWYSGAGHIPSGLDDFISFNEISNVSVSSNISLDSNNNKKLIIEKSGCYFVKIIKFVSNNIDSVPPTEGVYFYKNQDTTGSPTGDFIIKSIGSDGLFQMGTTSSASSANAFHQNTAHFVISPKTFSPTFFINITDDDIANGENNISIYSDLVVDANNYNYALEFSINRIGQVSTSTFPTTGTGVE